VEKVTVSLDGTSPYFARDRGIFVGSCLVDVVDLAEGVGYTEQEETEEEDNLGNSQHGV
jgi:hypothetical protein